MEFKARESRPEAATTETYTYRDYLNWPDGERWELINGIEILSPSFYSRER